jgi:hypothetical protein
MSKRKPSDIPKPTSKEDFKNPRKTSVMGRKSYDENEAIEII